MLAIWIANALTGHKTSSLPAGTQRIISELNVQITTESTLQDIITE